MDGAFPDGPDSPAAFRADPREAARDRPFHPVSGLTNPAGATGFQARSPRQMARLVQAAQPPGPGCAPAPALPDAVGLADIVERQAAAAARAPAMPPAAASSPPRPPAPAGDEIARARAAGLAEGRELGRSEAEATATDAARSTGAVAQALAIALARLDNPPPDTALALRTALDQAIARLAAERAGQAIDAAPAAFARRVARLADRVAQAASGLVVHLHPDDHAAILPLVAQASAPDLALLAGARLVPDPVLSRGDALVRAPGVTVSDLLSPDPPPAAPEARKDAS